jgi:hypothetical protein
MFRASEESNKHAEKKVKANILRKAKWHIVKSYPASCWIRCKAEPNGFVQCHHVLRQAEAVLYAERNSSNRPRHNVAYQPPAVYQLTSIGCGKGQVCGDGTFMSE